MNDENKPKSEFDATDFEDKLTPDQEKEARLARLLSSMGQGWKVSIIRVQPSWCRGHLETVEIYDPSEAIDIDYLIRTWGGQRLHVKIHNEKGDWVGGGSVSLFSYPPLVQGERITPKTVMTETPPSQTQINPVQQGPAFSGIDIPALFKLLQQGKKSELDLALKILERQPNMAAPAPAQPNQPMGSMFEQMGAMMQMFGQMREFLGDMSQGGAAPATGGDDLAPVIGDVVKGLLGTVQQNPQPTQARPTVVGPRPVPPVPGTPPPGTNNGDHRAPDLRPVEGIGVESLSAIANKLAGLSPEDSVDVIIQALGDMPADKRQAAIQTFMQSMMGDDSDLDGLLDTDDTYSQDEEDQPTPSTDRKTQGSGG
jgi:hypothetical protein